VRLGLGAVLLVRAQGRVAGALDQFLLRVVASCREILRSPVEHGEEARGLAERAFGLVEVRSGGDLEIRRRIELGVRVEVAGLGAVLAAGCRCLLLLALALLLGVAVFLAGIGVSRRSGVRVLRRRRGGGRPARTRLVVASAARDEQRHNG
jgi:hypothetical protein